MRGLELAVLLPVLEILPPSLTARLRIDNLFFFLSFCVLMGGSAGIVAKEGEGGRGAEAARLEISLTRCEAQVQTR